MHQDFARTVGFVAFFAASLAAQGRTIRVPGDYARLDQAVTAAADGDTVIMTSPTEVLGTYLVRGKALSIVSPNGTTLTLGSFVIENLPAGKEVSLFGFTAVSVVVHNCRGSVLVENCKLTHSTPLGGASAVAARDCDQVYLKDCALMGGPAVAAVRSSVLVSDSQLTGTPGQFVGHYFVQAGPAVTAVDSDFVVSRTPITGGSASSISSLLQPREALSLNRSRCVVTGLARTRIAAGAKAGAMVSAVVGVGEILAHPNVQFVPTGSAPPLSGVRLARAAVPSLQVGLGSTVSVDLASAPRAPFGLTVSIPGRRLPLGALGDAWHSATVLATAAAGSIPASGHFRTTYPRIVTPALLGRRLVWQAISGTATNGFLLSNPDTILIH